MTAATARVVLHPDLTTAPVDRRLFGTFVEHMGRCVYGGIWDPEHPSADAHGFRGDVTELAGELGVGLVRYPGGNFVSGYAWEDGVGPVGDRPRRLDLAWRSVEPNTVGTDEFLPWARRAGLEPVMAVNLGTRGAAEAAALVEYCNIASGTQWSDRRRSNGVREPHAVRTWCLGNEMDGPWQVGHTDAADYGRRAAQAGAAMRLVDPTVELVACGSSSAAMPTFGSWDRTVLEHTFDVADLVSVHAYQDGRQDRATFLASGAAFDAQLRAVAAVADAVAAARGSRRRIDLSVDEWNVWSSAPEDPTTGPAQDPLALRAAPRISEDTYQLLDAVVLGDLLVSLLANADRVRIACLSLLVNVSAPIVTDPADGTAHRQTTFHPFAAAARLARGNALHLALRSPVHHGDGHADVPVLAAAATHDPCSGDLAVFLTNRGGQPLPVEVRLADLPGARVRAAGTVAAAPPGAPALRPGHRAGGLRPLAGIAVAGTTLTAVLEPESWTALDLATTS